MTYCLIVGRVDRKLPELKTPRMKLVVSGETICRVRQGRSSARRVRGDHLQGVLGEIICRARQGRSSAGCVRGDHLQGVSGEVCKIYFPDVCSVVSSANMYNQQICFARVMKGL